MSEESILLSREPLVRRSWEGWSVISSSLLILWTATLAVDRVDFLGGEGAFILTPFLVLTPLLLIIEGFQLLEGRARRSLPRTGRAYLIVLLLFLSIVVISTLLAQDPLMSAKRSVLLMFLILGTLAVGMAISDRDDSKIALVRGAKLGAHRWTSVQYIRNFYLPIELVRTFPIWFSSRSTYGPTRITA